MAVALKSISKQIHWSLLVKAAIFACAWWFLPTWLFAIVALVLYFIPPFQTRRNLVPFLVLLGISLATPASILMAFIYGILCYYLFLIKDLLVIDRKSARAILAMALSFFLFREFFSAWSAGFSMGAFIVSWVVAIAFGALLNGVIVAHRNKEEEEDLPAVRRLRRTTVAIASVIMLEFLTVALFLPVDFIYQSIIVFLVAALFIDLVPAYFFHDLAPRRIRATAMAIFAMLVVTLASAKWGI
ncbi:MAG: hypothetical protein WCF77_01630 [Minisyncoccia bacterium]|jgi:hypothetical protein